MTKLIGVLLLGFLATLCQGADESKVKWTDWCAECKCVTTVNSMTIDCTKTFPAAPQTWPKEFVEDEHATNKSLMVTIHFTNMKKLLPFPEMKSKRVTMSLQNCQLEEISSAAFKNIKNIYFLSLAFNRLTGDAMRAEIFKGPYDNNLYEPIDLEVLHLESNLIHSLSRKIFEHTPKLRRLYLFNNPLGVLDDVTVLALASLKNLQLLDLSYTEISYLPDDLMRNTKSLQDLRLSGNKFKTVPESLGSVGSSLRWLTLNKNNIEQIDDNSFLGLWRLEHLEMGDMDELKRVKAGAFAQLRSLTMLHMVHNKNLREIDHDAFRELKKNWPIQELYLQDNSLETLPADLAPWDQLHSVNLENNNWICDCRMAINIKTKGIWRKIPLTSNARCTTPTAMGGVKLVELNPDTLCSANERNNITFGPPRYPLRSITRRSGSILIALGFVCSVVIIGLSLGCCLSYVRNKLRRVTFVEEVRYSHLIT